MDYWRAASRSLSRGWPGEKTRGLDARHLCSITAIQPNCAAGPGLDAALDEVSSLTERTAAGGQVPAGPGTENRTGGRPSSVRRQHAAAMLVVWECGSSDMCRLLLASRIPHPARLSSPLVPSGHSSGSLHDLVGGKEEAKSRGSRLLRIHDAMHETEFAGWAVLRLAGFPERSSTGALRMRLTIGSKSIGAHLHRRG